MAESLEPRLRTKMPPQRGSMSSYTGTGDAQHTGVKGYFQEKADDREALRSKVDTRYEIGLPKASSDIPAQSQATSEPKKLTMQEFGQTIKAKYPEYEKIDNYILAEKMLEKFPQYEEKVEKEKTLGQTLKETANTRGDQMTANTNAAEAGEMSNERALYRNVGEGIGMFKDIIVETASTAWKGIDRGLKRDFAEDSKVGAMTNPQEETKAESWINKGVDEIKARAEIMGEGAVADEFKKELTREAQKLQKINEENPELAKDAAPILNLAETALLYYGGIDFAIESLAPKTLKRVGTELLADATSTASRVKNPLVGLKESIQTSAGKKAERLATQGLMNVKDTRNVMNKLAETGDDDVGSVGRWALEKEIAGLEEKEAIKKLQEISSTTSTTSTYSQVRNIVNEASEKLGALGVDEKVANGMTIVGKQIDNLNDTAGYLAFNKAEVEAIQQAAKDGTITLAQKQRAKELIDDYVTIYNRSGDVALTKLGKIGSELRSSIRNDIEQRITRYTNGKVNLRALNRDVAVARAMEEGIKTKAASNMLKQYAIQGGLGAIAALPGNSDLASFETLGRFLAGAFLGRLAGKVLGSPVVMGKVAKAFDSISGGTRASLLEYIKSPTVKILTEKELYEIVAFQDRIYKLPEIKALPAPEGAAPIAPGGLPKVLRPQGVPQLSQPLRTVREKPSLVNKNGNVNPVSSSTDMSNPLTSDPSISVSTRAVSDSVGVKPKKRGLRKKSK